jgi:hypothetical protein
MANISGGYYAERHTLKMPKRSPVTFGEELKAIDHLGHHALKFFQRCSDRGYRVLEGAPAHLRVPNHEDWRRAVHFDAKAAPATMAHRSIAVVNGN